MHQDENQTGAHALLYGVEAAFIQDFQNILEGEACGKERDILRELHAADIADLIEQLSENDRNTLLTRLEGNINPETLSWLDEDLSVQIMENLPDTQLAKFLDHLENDDAIDVIERLDEEHQARLLRLVKSHDRAIYEATLRYPEDSAGRLMQSKVFALPSFWTVGQTIDHARNNAEKYPDLFHNLVVVGPMHKPIGLVSLAKLLRCPRPTALRRIMETDIKPVPADIDQEEVAALFRQYGLIEAPVVDAQDRLVGVISVDDILSVIDEEHEEDLLSLGGIGSGGDFFSDVQETTKSRLPWLLVNLLTAVAASLVIGFFSDTMQEIIALAVLMPIVASMGGNAGTQTLTVSVRALATNDLTFTNAGRAIVKELLVGIANGLIFALLVGILSWVWFGDGVIGVIIAASMVINMICAGIAGIAIPLVLVWCKRDPALASTVFLTTATDVVGFLSFLGFATLTLM
ncbi:MAG: magnesium transporter [Pseudomonadota bacterium]